MNWVVTMIVAVLFVFLLFIYPLLSISSEISRAEEAYMHYEEGEPEYDSDAEAD
jgi:hypothetical protein